MCQKEVNGDTAKTVTDETDFVCCYITECAEFVQASRSRDSKIFFNESMKTEKGAVGGKAQELQQKQNQKRKLAVRRMTAELPQTHTVSYKLKEHKKKGP